MNWTEAHKAMIRARYEAGESYAAIGITLGVSDTAIQRAIAPFGLDSEEARMRRLPNYVFRVRSYRSPIQMAEHLGLPLSMVHEALAALPSPKPKQRIADDRRARLQWAFDNRKTDREAALLWDMARVSQGQRPVSVGYDDNAYRRDGIMRRCTCKQAVRDAREEAA